MKDACVRYVLILAIRFYQKLLSPLSVGACRYYPSCSEYALWLLHFDGLFSALCKIAQRVLSCNQFFSGGIAYPVACVELQNIIFAPKGVKYWLVPTEKISFLDIMLASQGTYKIQVYIIKSFPKR